MSSEERWVRIENALQTVAERQALHEGQIHDLIAHGQQIDLRIEALSAHDEALSRRMDTLAQRVDTVTRNVGVIAENMIVLVRKVDDLSDIVRRREENRGI